MGEPCPRCAGRGEIATPNGQAWQPCWKCEGSGKDPGVEIFFQYLFDISLTTGQLARSIGTTILGEADFVWKRFMSTQTASVGATTGQSWRIRIGGGGGSWLSSGGQQQGVTSVNDFVGNPCIAGTAQFPFPIRPHPVIPRNGKILFDLEERASATNVVQLVFDGALWYPSSPTPQPSPQALAGFHRTRWP
jgi:hypothetical protein